MRVLIVNTLYTPYRVGGAEISVQAIAEGLQKMGIEVAVLTLGEKQEELISNHVRVYRAKLENSYWPFDDVEKSKIQKLRWHASDVYNTRYEYYIHEILDRFRPDILHTNNLMGFSVFIWDIAKQKNIKIVHTLRDYYLQCPKSNKFKRGVSCSIQCVECRFFSKRKKRESLEVDSVVGISHSILDNHLQEGYFSAAKKKVIYNGFHLKTSNFKRTSFTKDSFINFGFIGQINEAKGITFLLKNLSEFIAYDHWKLYVAGKVNITYKNHLLSFLPTKKIEFVGYVDQKDFFKTINVLIVPSLWEEPFGRVVLEGITHKVVVLGSKIGGIQEILKSNKEFTFDTNHDEFSKLIQAVLEYPEKLNRFNFELGDMDQFSIETMITRYKDVYLELST